MKFRMYDLSKPLPFSEGCAVEHLVQEYAPGKLLAAGDHPIKDGVLIYVKLQSRNVAEFIVHDDGYCLMPKHLRLEGGVWKTHNGKEFQPDPTLVIETD